MYFEGTVVARFVNERALRAVSGAAGKAKSGPPCYLVVGVSIFSVVVCRICSFSYIFKELVSFLFVRREEGGGRATVASIDVVSGVYVLCIIIRWVICLVRVRTYIHVYYMYVCVCVYLFVVCVV